MAESSVFDWVCEELEERTSLDRLESRGTVRLMLKQAGLEPRSVDAQQMDVAIERLLPAELESRGIENADETCFQLRTALSRVEIAPTADTPEAVFERLGG